MNRSGYWVIRTYESGNVGEKIKYFVSGNKPRSKRAYKSDIRKQELNFNGAVRSLARLINANYAEGDVLLGLDYSDKGMAVIKRKALTSFVGGKKRTCVRVRACEENSEEYMLALRASAEHELRLVLRRVKRACEKKGIELKYISVTSDMDGKTGEAVRIHHHLIINREAAELFRDKWKHGGVFAERMRTQEDYTELARYLLEQVRKIPDNKKFISSRNLVRPKPKDRIVFSGAEVRVPKGAKLLYRSEYNEHKPQYLRYYIPKELKQCTGLSRKCEAVP